VRAEEAGSAGNDDAFFREVHMVKPDRERKRGQT
jgi:hypothetical protein